MMTARQINQVRNQLSDYVEEFAGEFGRSERRYWCVKYMEGLLREGERKSIEPMAARVGGDDQALQQFVNQSPWDHDAVMFRLRTLMRRRAAEGGVLVLDDTTSEHFSLVNRKEARGRFNPRCVRPELK